MTPILFYGVPEGCSFGSIVAFEWTGLPYRLCRIAMPETVSGDDYRRINPVGETPSLMTGSGALVSESMAILNHIAARAVGRGLGFPQDSAAFDRLNQMLAFLNTGFFDAFSPLWHVVEHDDIDGPARDALVAYGRAKVEKAHGDLEAMLAGRDWLLGDERSLADAYFFGIARWADFHRAVDRRDYPRVHRLYETLAADPAVRFARAVEHGEPAETTGGFAGEIDLGEALQLLRQHA